MLEILTGEASKGYKNNIWYTEIKNSGLKCKN